MPCMIFHFRLQYIIVDRGVMSVYLHTGNDVTDATGITPSSEAESALHEPTPPDDAALASVSCTRYYSQLSC